MTTPVKQDNIFFGFGGLPIIEVSANSIAKSDVLDVSSVFMAQLFIDYCPTNTGVITTAPELYIESTPFPTGDDAWRPVKTFGFNILTPSSSAVDGAEPAASTLIEETATGTLANGQLVFFKNASLQNSEWSKVQSVSGGASFTLFDGLKNAQTGSTWFNMGQYITEIIDLGGIKRLRALVNNNRAATARSIAVRVGMVQLTSLTA